MELKTALKKGAGQFREMSKDLESMEQMLADYCSGAGGLSEGLTRVNSSGGKRLRPMLAWICWSIAGKKGPVVPLMCMLELMHTASLIHDDIVDNADKRRGTETINKRSGIPAAVQSGDYLLARAMELLKIYRGTGINEALSQVSELMCIGELRQQERLFETGNSAEDDYREYIFGKTAAFIAESCRCGAIAGGAPEQTSQSMWEYGKHLGMAFQMRDDYLDWVEDAETGKTTLQDLRSGSMTLPLIVSVKQGIINSYELINSKTKSEEDIQYILQLVRAAGALEIARGYIQQECSLAVGALRLCPEGPEKSALTQLANSISEVK